MPIQKGLGKGLGSLIPNKKQESQGNSSSAITAKSFGLPLTKENKEDSLVRGLPAEMSKTPKGSAPALKEKSGITTMLLKNIAANPYQPREHFEHQQLEDLVSSIKRHGILQPLVVSQKDDGSYELIAGERRLRAAEIAGLAEVPVILRDAVNAEQQLELAVIENVQRADLNPIEEANAYNRLMEEFGLTQEEVAQKIGKSRAKIANVVRLLSLPQEIQDALKSGRITEGHGKILAGLATQSEQLRVFKQIAMHGLSVSETFQHTTKKAPAARITPTVLSMPELRADEKLLENALSTKVSLHDNKGKGKIVVEYYSPEERKAIVEKITKIS